MNMRILKLMVALFFFLNPGGTSLYAQKAKEEKQYYTPALKRYLQKSRLRKDYGIVLCSFTVPAPRALFDARRYAVLYRGGDERRPGRAGKGLMFGATYYPAGGPVIETDSTWTIYQTFVVRKGSYRLYNYVMDDVQAFGSTRYTGRRQFNLPFEVKENTINYLGDFHFSGTLSKTLVGIEQSNGGIVLHSNRFRHDESLLRGKYKVLDFTRLSIQPLKLSDSSAGFLVIQ